MDPTVPPSICPLVRVIVCLPMLIFTTALVCLLVVCLSFKGQGLRWRRQMYNYTVDKQQHTI
jgi:hypothetical protein